jgi:hypothetical protein
MAKALDAPRTRGRKTRRESRSAVFRQQLLIWKQAPAAIRPSLRALARSLDTSHQLLRHYLVRLEKWQYEERYRRAKKQADEIRARVEAENRSLTFWEEQQVRACDTARIRALIGPALLAALEGIKRDAKRGLLDRYQFKTLKLFARRNYPGAQELLQKCSEVGLKPRKRFAEIVKDTPRREGEDYISWVRRIWDECEKYDTNCPTSITVELLDKYSRGSGGQNGENNLPVPVEGVAKPFRCEQRRSGNSATSSRREVACRHSNLR